MDESGEALIPMMHRYFTSAADDPNPIGAFGVIGDIYLVRAHREHTHPILGAGCVAYFPNAGRADPAIGATTACCARLWADGEAQDGDLDSIERQAKQLADDWVTNRVRSRQATGLDQPAALRSAQ